MTQYATRDSTPPSDEPPDVDGATAAHAPCPILVLDACVLLPGTLRRLLLRLAAHGCFLPAWSHQIADEWLRNAARVWQLDRSAFEDDWQAMQQRYPDAMAHDIGHYKTGLQYSDPKDWHVIAAARCMQADHPGQAVGILTRNLKDFNRSELRRLGLFVIDPDRQLASWWPRHAGHIEQALLANESDAHCVDWRAGGPQDILARERLFRLRGRMAASLTSP